MQGGGQYYGTGAAGGFEDVTARHSQEELDRKRAAREARRRRARNRPNRFGWLHLHRKHAADR